MPTEFNELIPENALWDNGEGMHVASWLSAFGNYEHAIAYAELFWPQFVEQNGCILRGGLLDDERFQNWMQATNGDKTALEATVNHKHIVDIFVNVPQPPTKLQIRHLGCKLKEMWEAKVRQTFPDRKIVVTFPEEDLHDLVAYEITVFQQRDEAGE